MKLAITGKGGVGKTTTASLLAQSYAAAGQRVIAIDANPDANLALALGFDPILMQKIIPISEMSDLIEERTGARPGSMGSIFKMNPRVDDIPDRFAIVKENIRLLVMGSVKRGEGGCLCPESSLLKSLISHLVFRTSDVVIMDMDAGVEHLGRGTAKAMDAFIIVVEPGQRSFQTARSIKVLASDLGISRHFIIGSKVTGEADKKFITDSLQDFEILGFLDYNVEIVEADKKGANVFDNSPQAVQQITLIKDKLDELFVSKKGG